MTDLPAFTRLYGWSHFEDYSTATLWISVLFLPIIPLKKIKLRVRTNFEGEFITKEEMLLAAIGSRQVAKARENNAYEILGQESFAGAEVLSTLLAVYIGFPLLVLWPFILMGGLYLSVVSAENLSNDSAVKVVAFALYFPTLLACIANVFTVPIWAIRRTRGKKAVYWVDWLLKKAGVKYQLFKA
ncbi:hypothetical protein [Zooshikella sp. RANM57]|uniref:hypothetical protein n=1 Tax=Zooshikella sp. RANM57 TaxID=3425863 RepID=UPI003D6E0529